MWIHFQKFSHDFTIFFIAMNSHINSWLWIHIWFHEFIYDFIIMNSLAWISRWIHIHMILQYSSWSWIHIWIHIINSYKISWSWIHMRHLMTYEFIYEFMFMKNIVKSYLKSCVLRFQMISWHKSHVQSARDIPSVFV